LKSWSVPYYVLCGDPARRQRVVDDVADGKVSAAAAREQYGR